MKYDSEKFTDHVKRIVLAKIIGKIAKCNFHNYTLEFFTYPLVDRHGTELEKRNQSRNKNSKHAHVCSGNVQC